MRKQFTIRVTTLILISLAFCLTANAQTQQPKTYENKEEAQKNAEKGIAFKIPQKVMPIEWADFKGILMLSAKKPSGIFISYPNDGETIEILKERAGKSIAKMFVHDEKKAGNIEWQVKSVPSHPGDKGDSASMKIYDSETETLQITFYERESNGLSIIYGYFARKSKTSKVKDDSADFLDDKGQGIDVFDDFWKTFPNK